MGVRQGVIWVFDTAAEVKPVAPGDFAFCIENGANYQTNSAGNAAPQMSMGGAPVSAPFPTHDQAMTSQTLATGKTAIMAGAITLAQGQTLTIQGTGFLKVL